MTGDEGTGSTDRADGSGPVGSLVERSLLRTALVSWFAVRLVVAAVWVLLAIVDRSEPVERVGRGLLAWDGDWYALIARHGYSTGGEEIRFFPLHAWLGRAVGLPFGDRPGLGLVVVANVAALAAAVLLGTYVVRRFGDEQLGRAAIWAMTLWPAAFVLVFAYAEGLFLTLTLACALALSDRRWLLAALAGALAALTRPTGAALVVLAVAAAVAGWGDAPPREKAERMLAVLGPAIGVGVFMVLAERWFGEWDGPFDAQEPFRGDVVDPVSRLWRGLGDAVGPERIGDGLHFPFAVVAVAAVVLVWREVGRVEALYTAAFVVVAISADNWNSIERYTLNAFPIFVAFGAAAVAGRRAVRRGAALVSGAGLAALTTLAWTGHYVP